MSEVTIQYLVLDRFDPVCNMARYYVLAIEPSLFGNPTLIRVGPDRTSRAEEGRAL